MFTAVMVDDANDDGTVAQQPAVKVDELITKCHDLLNELEGFQKFLVEQKRSTWLRSGSFVTRWPLSSNHLRKFAFYHTS